MLGFRGNRSLGITETCGAAELVPDGADGEGRPAGSGERGGRPSGRGGVGNAPSIQSTMGAKSASAMRRQRSCELRYGGTAASNPASAPTITWRGDILNSPRPSSASLLGSELNLPHRVNDFMSKFDDIGGDDLGSFFIPVLILMVVLVLALAAYLLLA
jgi:hypothetical protein